MVKHLLFYANSPNANPGKDIQFIFYFHFLFFVFSELDIMKMM